MIPIILLIAAAALFVWAYILDWRSNSENRNSSYFGFFRSPGFLKSLAVILGLLGAYAEYQSQVANLEDTLNTITGGDSYVYVRLASATNDSHVVSFELEHSGEYTVYDIRVRVFRTDEYWNPKKDGQYIQRSFEYSDPAMSPGSMPVQLKPHFDVYDPNEVIEPPEVVRFIAVVSARNTNFVQLIRLKSAKPDWITDSLLLERGNISSVRYEIGNSDAVLREAKHWEAELSRLQRPNYRESNTAAVRRRRMTN